MPAHWYSLHLSYIKGPYLHVHHILPPRQKFQKINRCESIDKILFKGPKSKDKFWKTNKKGSLIGDVQRLIFFMISHARNWPTIKIYLAWLEK